MRQLGFGDGKYQADEAILSAFGFSLLRLPTPWIRIVENRSARGKALVIAPFSFRNQLVEFGKDDLCQFSRCFARTINSARVDLPNVLEILVSHEDITRLAVVSNCDRLSVGRQ